MASITGKRISRSHTTVTDLARLVASMLNNCDFVTKISLSFITVRGGIRTRKITADRDQFNLKVTVQEPSAKQELYVSSPDREKVIGELRQWCTKAGIEFVDR